MTQAIAKYAAKKMLSTEMNKYKGKSAGDPYDPFYELIPHPKKPGKTKKVKKQIPDYIPPEDAEILARARKSAYRLDFCLFNFLGFRFGWSSVIGLVPAVGDAADAALGLLLIKRMNKVKGKLPAGVLIHMLINMIIDFLVGLVPFVGDLADAYVKCNSKNVRLFEAHLDNLYKPKELVEAEKKADKEDKAAGKEPKKRRPATVYEDFSDDEQDRPNAFDDNHDNVRQPTRAYSRERVPDVEMGIAQPNTQGSRQEDPRRSGTKSSRRH